MLVLERIEEERRKGTDTFIGGGRGGKRQV
jgi:hypothetical protein